MVVLSIFPPAGFVWWFCRYFHLQASCGCSVDIFICRPRVVVLSIFPSAWFGGSFLEPRKLVGKSAGLVIERFRVRILAGAVGEFSSPKLVFCADSYTPLTQRSQSRMTMPLSRHSVRTYPETSSHATCHGTFGHSHLSSLSHCGLILV